VRVGVDNHIVDALLSTTAHTGYTSGCSCRSPFLQSWPTGPPTYFRTPLHTWSWQGRTGRTYPDANLALSLGRAQMMASFKMPLTCFKRSTRISAAPRIRTRTCWILTCHPAELPTEVSRCRCGVPPVADEDYIPDRQAAAMLGPGAFRKILQQIYGKPASVFHVHRHDHHGRPGPSNIDKVESRNSFLIFGRCAPSIPRHNNS